MKKLLITFYLIFGFLSLNASNITSILPQKPTIKVELEIRNKEAISNFKKFFDYIKDILGPLVALLGIFLTLPILKKKLIENHITTKLNEIQSANTEIQSYNHKLIEKYIPLTYSNDLLKKDDLEKVLNDLKKGFHISQKASSDVATLMFYLKVAIQGVIKHYDEEETKSFFTRNFYVFILDNLDLVNYYSTQVVQIPKSTKIQKGYVIVKNLRKYVSFSQISQFKHFKLGIISSPDSAHFTIFSDNVNKSNNALLMRATFQIFNSPKAVAKLLFANKIYAPSKLTQPNDDPISGLKSLDLYLIGFTIKNQINMEANVTTKVVDLIYSNPIDSLRFVKGLKKEKLKSDFKDSWIEKSQFELSLSSRLEKTEIETFKLEYDYQYLKKMFKKNKKK